MLDPPDPGEEDELAEVRVAFDGDAVLFDDASERLFQARGLDEFQLREAALADEPLSPGPFRPFLDALARVQARFPEGRSPIRTALVTARGAPAHKRVVNTLRTWNVRVDETFFLGGLDKTEILRVFRPHIFFDDRVRHLERAASVVPSAHVLQRVHQLDLFPYESDARQRRRTALRPGVAEGRIVALPSRPGQPMREHVVGPADDSPLHEQADPAIEAVERRASSAQPHGT